VEIGGYAGFGKSGKTGILVRGDGETQRPMHIAFIADNRDQVQSFLRSGDGGRRDGQRTSRHREIYHPNYFGAFVTGPDGHNVGGRLP